jgi:hypothetical protein
MVMALTTVAAIKTHLGITGSDEDTYLTQLLAGLEPAVLRWLNRLNIERATVTEFYNGGGRPLLPLKRRPVISVASVNEDVDGMGGQNPDGFGSDTLLESGVDYWTKNFEENESNPGMLVRVKQGWANAEGAVKVVYTSGYATVPADIALAVHLMAGLLRTAGDKGGPIQAETIGSYSYSLMAGAVGSSAEMMQVQSLLAPYREIAI